MNLETLLERSKTIESSPLTRTEKIEYDAREERTKQLFNILIEDRTSQLDAFGDSEIFEPTEIGVVGSEGLGVNFRVHPVKLFRYSDTEGMENIGIGLCFRESNSDKNIGPLILPDVDFYFTNDPNSRDMENLNEFWELLEDVSERVSAVSSLQS